MNGDAHRLVSLVAKLLEARLIVFAFLGLLLGLVAFSHSVSALFHSSYGKGTVYGINSGSYGITIEDEISLRVEVCELRLVN